jgi:hypothetical protein
LGITGFDVGVQIHEYGEWYIPGIGIEKRGEITPSLLSLKTNDSKYKV